MALTLFYATQGIKHSLVRGWSKVKLLPWSVRIRNQHLYRTE